MNLAQTLGLRGKVSWGTDPQVLLGNCLVFPLPKEEKAVTLAYVDNRWIGKLILHCTLWRVLHDKKPVIVFFRVILYTPATQEF